MRLDFPTRFVAPLFYAFPFFFDLIFSNVMAIVNATR